MNTHTTMSNPCLAGPLVNHEPSGIYPQGLELPKVSCASVAQLMVKVADLECRLAEETRLKQSRVDALARLVHELRTPVGAILGFAGLLQRRGGLLAHQAKAVDMILTSGTHQKALIDDILDVARLDARMLQLQPHWMSLEESLTDTLDMLRPQAEAAHLRLQASLPASMIVRADERRLRQILLNLLSNAIKFTRQGTVKLEVVCLSAPSDTCARLRFMVKDSGPGMSPDQQARLFHLFRREGEVPEGPPGSGIGLVVTRELVRLMGSELVICSEPGQGTLISFDLDLELYPPAN